MAAAATMAWAQRDPLSATQAWWTTAALAGAAIVARSLAGHAAAQPTGRGLAIAAQLTHLVAGSVWMGVVGQLLAARLSLRRATAPGALRLVAAVVSGFSPLAAASAGLLAASGLFAAWRYLETPGASHLRLRPDVAHEARSHRTAPGGGLRECAQQELNQ